MRTYYEPLNEWANGFEKQFRFMMSNLKYFFDKWLAWKGGFGTFEQLQEKEITFTLDRDMMIDETEIIQNIVALKEELSQETRDELNPYIDDVEREKERRENEEKEQLEKDDLLLRQNNDLNNNLDDDINNNDQNDLNEE